MTAAQNTVTAGAGTSRDRKIQPPAYPGPVRLLPHPSHAPVSYPHLDVYKRQGQDLLPADLVHTKAPFMARGNVPFFPLYPQKTERSKTMVPELERLIQKSSRLVFFGGAGVSTESGIPDFRSVDGLYHQTFRYPPETMLSHTFFVPVSYTHLQDGGRPCGAGEQERIHRPPAGPGSL